MFNNSIITRSSLIFKLLIEMGLLLYPSISQMYHAMLFISFLIKSYSSNVPTYLNFFMQGIELIKVNYTELLLQ